MDSKVQNVRMFVFNGGGWSKSPSGLEEFMPSRLRRVLELPFDLTYSQMKSCVAKKFNIFHFNISKMKMCYEFPFSSPDQNKRANVEIADDDDVKILMDIAKKGSHGPLTLCVYYS
ncbi:hypothetical protein Hanom_Chr07g00595781 [Helianthus anomalus]